MAASHKNPERKRSQASSGAASLVALAFVVVACGGHDTAASRSAAAYDEALRKGTPIEKGDGHGGHGAPAGEKPAQAEPPPHAEHAAAESSAKAGADQHAAMPGMDHAHMSASGSRERPAATGMDHSKMAGMDHARMAAPGADKQHAAGMDHSKTVPIDHAAMGHGMPMPPSAPEPAATSAQPGQPGATLRADAIDGPATTSLRDAERSEAMAKVMAGGHGVRHGAPYRQLDAGRDPETSPAPAPKPSPHRQEGSR
jgi:uncharacterized protein involved in copper resistance